MNKKVYEGSIREQMIANSNHSKQFIAQFSKELFHSINNGLLENGYVKLHNFGSLRLKWTQQRNGRNPQTGEVIIIPAHPRIQFLPSKHLRQIIQPHNDETTTQKSVSQTETANTKNTAESFERDLNKLNISLKDAGATKNNKTILISSIAVCMVFLIIGYIIFPYNSSSHLDPLSITATNSSQTILNADIDESPLIQVNQSKNQPVITGLNQSEKSVISNTVQIAETTNNTSNDYLVASNAPDDLETATNQENNTDTIPVYQVASASSQDVPDSVFFKEQKYRLRDGNSLWRLSLKHYINPFYWPHIYQANRYKIHNPDKLQMGKIITLPTLYGKPDELTLIDKRNIAEGYFLAYQYYKRKKAPHPYYALLGALKYDSSIIKKYIYEISDEDWENIQLVSNLPQ